MFLKNPTLYQNKSSFINSLKDKLNNDNFEVSVSLKKFDDISADVLINGSVVGIVSSYGECEELPKDVILSFVPDVNFFSLVNWSNVKEFVSLSNNFMKAYINTISLNNTHYTDEERAILGEFHFPSNEKIDKTLDDCNSFAIRYFAGSFLGESIDFQELSRISFNLVQIGESFNLIDNFKMDITTRNPSILILSSIRNSNFKPSDQFCFSLEKKGDIFSIKHKCHNSLHSICFNRFENKPNMNDFISNICYYVYMNDKQSDIPSFEDFLKTAAEYKQVFEMSLI